MTGPRYTVPEEVGRLRPLAELRLGWWVYLVPNPGYPEEVPSWERVDWIADTNLGRRIVHVDCEDGGNTFAGHRHDLVVMLTSVEARRAGLR